MFYFIIIVFSCAVAQIMHVIKEKNEVWSFFRAKFMMIFRISIYLNVSFSVINSNKFYFLYY